MPITTEAVLKELQEVEKDCDALKKRIDGLVVMALAKHDRDILAALQVTKDEKAEQDKLAN